MSRTRSRAESADKVKELYTERASFYDRFFIDFLGWGRELEAFFRECSYLTSGLKILDAGCGTGIVTKTLYKLTQEKDLERVSFYAFDLTERMLDIFREWITAQEAENIEVRQADVLELTLLPTEWRDFDLVVTSTMLEYLPRDKVAHALANLRKLLRDDGLLLVFITKRSFVTKWLAGRWWKTNTFTKSEIKKVFREAGFATVEFRRLSKTSWWANYILVTEVKK